MKGWFGKASCLTSTHRLCNPRQRLVDDEHGDDGCYDVVADDCDVDNCIDDDAAAAAAAVAAAAAAAADDNDGDDDGDEDDDDDDHDVSVLAVGEMPQPERGFRKGRLRFTVN